MTKPRKDNRYAEASRLLFTTYKCMVEQLADDVRANPELFTDSAAYDPSATSRETYANTLCQLDTLIQHLDKIDRTVNEPPRTQQQHAIFRPTDESEPVNTNETDLLRN